MTGRAPDFSQAAWLPNATSGPCLKFFQQRDLARVIELMLGDSVEHEGDVVPLARDAFAEAVFGETARRAEQVRMRFSGLGNGLLPRRGALVGDGREILAPLQLHGLAKDDAAVDGIVPGGDVEYEFPDTVSACDEMRGGGFRGDTGEKLQDSGAVPCCAGKGVFQWLGDAGGFRHGLASCRFQALPGVGCP